MQTARVTPWPAKAIWEQIAPLLPGFTIEVLPEIDSTNTELMRRAKAGRIEPILLVAEKQTAGRGRLGREWHDLSAQIESPSTQNSLPSLTFSLGIPLSPVDWSGLSLAVGISVAQSLHPRIGLKWPNDLWLCDEGDERKLAGILIETCAIQNTTLSNQRYVVIGVGINIAKPSAHQTAAQLPLRTPAAWLHELLPKSSAPNALLRIMPNLIQTILTFSEHGFAPFQTRFNTLDVLKNRQVSIDNNQLNTLASTKTAGVAHGVNHKGELQIQTVFGTETVNSSEVSVKPL